MFLFKCCQEFSSGVGYQLHRSPNSIQFLPSLKEIDPRDLTNDKVTILKIKKSLFEEVHDDYTRNKKKFIDQQFPAHEASLGEIQGLQYINWKRVSELITSPVLLGPKVEPSQVIQGSLGDCYFLSAMAALAEREEHIRALFEGQTYNPAGIYKVVMRIHGELEEVVVDDFVPVNQNGQPLFCQPCRNEFWMLILQKAWAKIHGSYANIIMGIPTAVFKGLTLGPADVLAVKNKNQEKERIWPLLIQFTQAHYPIVCQTRNQLEKETNSIGSGLSYTLLEVGLLEDVQGVYHKLLKLRDPWGRGTWEGACSQSDRPFWSKIVMSQQRKQFQKKPENGSTGIFYINFNDFCTYFSRIHYCLLVPHTSYNSEQLFVNKKNGRLFEVKVEKKGSYYFELHQSQVDAISEQQKRQEGLCRSTLLLIKRTQQGYEFVNGLLKYNEQDAILSETLETGNYLLFVKVDPTRSKQLIPTKTIVSVYSPTFTLLESVQQTKYPNLMKQAFLNHARGYKKNKYNNGLMWISWKLLLQQGGYAYVAVGVDALSNKKFVIDFSEQDFNKMNFKLKGEYKGKGNQRIEVMPGEQKIILARVENQLIRTLKFPPNIGIKMELVPGH